MNGIQALCQIGLADEVQNTGIVLSRLVTRSANGKSVVSSDMAAPAKTFGVPFIAIHCARLRQVLSDAAGLGGF